MGNSLIHFVTSDCHLVVYDLMTITIIWMQAFKWIPSMNCTKTVLTVLTDSYSFNNLQEDKNGSYIQLIVADKNELSPDCML